MENYPDSYYAQNIETLKKPYDQLIDNHECDICVVGGGFSGLSTAIEAAKKGLKVIVIEQNLFGWGASGRNGGQIWNDVSWGIDVIEKKYGIKLARQIWDISQASVDLIDDRIREFDIECDKKNGGISAATSAAKLREYEENREYKIKTYNYNNLELLDKNCVDKEIGSSLYYGGVLDKGAGHLHPIKYALGLVKAAEKLNVKLYERSVVTKINQTSHTVEVLTDRGMVKAKKIAVCCNAYIKGLNLGIENRIMPCATYIDCTLSLIHISEPTRRS